MTFGQELRRARVAAGLSQGELAGDRCSLSYISHLETGRRAPNPDLVRYFEARLGLAAGTLSDDAALTQVRQRRSADADHYAAYCEAVASWRSGEYGHALESAMELRKVVPARGREDLQSLLRELLVDVNIDLGRYDDAMGEAQRYLEAAQMSGSAMLEVRAACLWSKVARLGGKTDDARSAARVALDLTAQSALSESLRADALRAAIAAGLDEERHAYTASVEELQEITPRLERSRDRGLAAWVIGNALMRRGEIDQGITWHDDAASALTPMSDFRNWARFPGASADERLNAGTDKGVEDLLAEAERRLTLLDSADSLATLTLIKAQFAQFQGRGDDARAYVDDALNEIDLPPRTRGSLHLSAARLHADAGRSDEARTSALQAARLFTEAGDTQNAQEAWKLID